MCLNVAQLVEFDRDYNRAAAIFPTDSCCSTTFDLRYAAAAGLHLICIWAGGARGCTLSRIGWFLMGDQRV